MYMWIVWLVIFVLALLIESLTDSIVSIWFALGALIALALSSTPWYVSTSVFVVVSFASFLFLRPLFKKIVKFEEIPSNIDEIIGKCGLMIKDYNELDYGEVKVNGVIWTAINEDEKDSIKSGSKVKVVAVSGNKLVVKVEA